MEGSKGKCWSCGSKKMKAGKTWFECQDCGATWVPPQKTGFDPYEVTRHRDIGLKGAPTKSAARDAAAARDAKWA